jgi:hypothetical protein
MLKLDQMLADFALVHERKLFISGAGINLIRGMPDADSLIVRFCLAVTIRASREDEGQHQIRISILDPSGNSVAIMENQGAEIDPQDAGKIIGSLSLSSPPDGSTDQEFIIPATFGFSPLRVPQAGSYQLITEIGSVTSSIKFDITGPPAPKMMKITGDITAINCGTGVKFTGPGGFDLRDLRMRAVRNDVAIEVDNVEVQDYDTVIE